MIKRSPSSGFSIVELLVVVGILSIVAGLMLPSIGKAHRYAQAVKCRSQLQQIGVALAAYAGSRDAWLVPVGVRPGPATMA